MSLVNNMLRDLDQRRKDSDGSGGAVRLMPAREFSPENKRSLLPVAVGAIVLVLVGLIYYWSQIGNSAVEQRLDIQIQPVLSDSQRVVRELEESIAIADARETAQRENTPEVQTASRTEEPEVSRVEEVRDEPAVNFLRSNVEPVSRTTPAVAKAPPVEPEINSTEPPLVSSAESLANEPNTSMKEEPRYSNEQLDTIAVQEALRLIANGQTEAAFETLESYIIENRSAHQSRETYGKLLMSRGRAADAAALIDAGLDMVPNHSGFKKVKARLLMSEGKISEAVATLISRAPDVEVDSEYHDLLASAQLSSRDFSGAIISYQGLLEHDQSQGKWWYGYAAANDQLGNTSIARQAYLRSMEYSNLSANLRRRSQERVVALNP